MRGLLLRCDFLPLSLHLPYCTPTPPYPSFYTYSIFSLLPSICQILAATPAHTRPFVCLDKYYRVIVMEWPIEEEITSITAWPNPRHTYSFRACCLCFVWAYCGYYRLIYRGGGSVDGEDRGWVGGASADHVVDSDRGCFDVSSVTDCNVGLFVGHVYHRCFWEADCCCSAEMKA